MIKRPNFLTTITVMIPGLPLPIWVPLLSLWLWSLTIFAGIVLMCLPKRTIQRRVKHELPFTPFQLGKQLIKFANIMLFSGSFVLCDVFVSEAEVRVRVRTI